MKTKEKSLRELLADIQKASELERYDPAADLALLAAQYRKMSRWDFGKLLDGMAAKYQNEWSAIHAALAERGTAEEGAGRRPGRHPAVPRNHGAGGQRQ